MDIINILNSLTIVSEMSPPFIVILLYFIHRDLNKITTDIDNQKININDHEKRISILESKQL